MAVRRRPRSARVKAQLRRLINAPLWPREDDGLSELRAKVLDRFDARLGLRKMRASMPRHDPAASPLWVELALDREFDGELEAIDSEGVALSDQRNRAAAAGSLRTVRDFDARLAQLEDRRLDLIVAWAQAKRRCDPEGFRLRAAVEAPHRPERIPSCMAAARADLADLIDLKLDAGAPESERHEAIVKHLQACRARRVARRGGHARGAQRKREGRRTCAAVGRLVAAGLKTAEIAAKLDLTPRRVRQIKAEISRPRNP